MFKVEVEPLYAPKMSKEEKKAAAKAKREARKAAKEAAKATKEAATEKAAAAKEAAEQAARERCGAQLFLERAVNDQKAFG